MTDIIAQARAKSIWVLRPAGLRSHSRSSPMAPPASSANPRRSMISSQVKCVSPIGKKLIGGDVVRQCLYQARLVLTRGRGYRYPHDCFADRRRGDQPDADHRNTDEGCDGREFPGRLVAAAQ